MARTRQDLDLASDHARWFAAALCYLHWAHDANQPPVLTLDLLARDIAALAQGDRTASLNCLDYSLYRQDQPQPPRRRRRATK